MKRWLKWISLIGVALVLLIGGANDWQQHEMASLGGHSEWFQCQSDDQCIVTEVTCSDRGVNKVYLEQIHQADTYSCSSHKGAPQPDALAKCIKGECLAIEQQWYACQTDDQCVLTRGACGNILSVNADFLSAFLRQEKQASTVSSCKKVSSPDQHLVAKCSDNKCIAATEGP